MGAVVGVDASISSTGLVLLHERETAFHRVQTKERGNDISSRIERMRESVVKTYSRIEPILTRLGAELDLVVIESPAFGKNNGQTHMLAGHWWLMVHALEKHGPVATVATGTLKKFATGDGKATKQRVHAAAVAAFPNNVPASFQAGNDIADASVLAAMGQAYLGREFGGVFAPSGAGSVHSVRWPELRKGASK